MGNILLYLIIAFVLGGFLLSRWLERKNSAHWQPTIPEPMKGVFDEEKYQKARDYDIASTKLGNWSGLFNTIILLAMLVLGGFAVLNSHVEALTPSPVWQALIFFGVLMVGSDLLNIGFQLKSTFGIEKKFGFNRMTPATFMMDKLKGYILSALFGGGLLALVIWFYLETGQYFWLLAWGATTLVMLFVTMFYTTLLVPIFNKLTPLEDGDLRRAIEAYAAKVNFPLKRIYVMDGSKRSAKSNAYFSGLGSHKSIVLFDTLIDNHTTEELVAVIAHEVGHYKKKHTRQGFIASIVQTGIIFFLFGWLIDNPALGEALGADHTNFHLGAIGFTMIYSPVSMVTGIIMNIVSRKNEFEADAYAKETYGGEPLGKALKKLSADNLSNLTPDPAYVWVYYSHPPVLQRLAALHENEKMKE